MNQKVRDLAVAWWKKQCAITAAECTIDTEREKLTQLNLQQDSLTDRIGKAASPGTKVIEVEPGVCVVLAWNSEREYHDIEIADKLSAENLT
jgi:hypothetical protein